MSILHKQIRIDNETEQDSKVSENIVFDRSVDRNAPVLAEYRSAVSGGIRALLPNIVRPERRTAPTRVGNASGRWA
ncbi:hypothetical protein QE430_000241 [Microbacterium testaceum]|uniref:hypothetical protein n=1 Tax=Microbacterium testaceum TaxID=2033 RepID=UPI002783ECDD|nr:hypothetical protein [Microbacterium testaceum]MDQ1171934.1 hypothetical protein [Microbacterium testaceum]